MSFWWVNHKQTAKHEIGDGYIWSPKVKKDGKPSVPYSNMTKTSVGDTIFSYANGVVPAIGRIVGPCIAEKRPLAFGTTGRQWNEDGWYVPVEWRELSHPFSPRGNMGALKDLLPERYSPLRVNGNGNQGFYLSAISEEMGNVLLSLIDGTNFGASDELEEMEEEWKEDEIETEINQSKRDSTVKRQLVLSRVGQGVFRKWLSKIEKKCRVTGIYEPSLLIASHIKPWKISSDDERLDGNNGLLLSPHVDKLFDRGWISFSAGGQLMVNLKAIGILQGWSISLDLNVGRFNKKQLAYLDYHRSMIFKG